MKSKNQNSNGAVADFLPENYEVPKSSDGYMKWEQGDNKFRILSKPIIGWVDWKDKKPLRYRMSEKPSTPIDPTQPVKHFWAMIVYNHKAERIQVLEITQKTILEAIKTYASNEDWGAPYSYDLTVNKKGSDLTTEYSVIASPHKPVSSEIIAAFNERPIDLQALFSGGDPFASTINCTPLEVAL